MSVGHRKPIKAITNKRVGTGNDRIAAEKNEESALLPVNRQRTAYEESVSCLYVGSLLPAYRQQRTILKCILILC